MYAGLDGAVFEMPSPGVSYMIPGPCHELVPYTVKHTFIADMTLGFVLAMKCIYITAYCKTLPRELV